MEWLMIVVDAKEKNTDSKAHAQVMIVKIEAGRAVDWGPEGIESRLPSGVSLNPIIGIAWLS